MPNLCRVTKVKVFLVLVYIFNFDLFEFSAAINQLPLHKCAVDATGPVEFNVCST